MIADEKILYAQFLFHDPSADQVDDRRDHQHNCNIQSKCTFFTLQRRNSVQYHAKKNGKNDKNNKGYHTAGLFAGKNTGG